MADSFVFLHIGKTAGTTVREAISMAFPAAEVCPLMFHRQIRELRDEEKSRYRLYAAHVGFDLAMTLTGETDNMFTMLRDPVERVLSLYSYWREIDGDGGGKGPSIAKSLDIDEFLESQADAVVASVVNTQTWQLAYGHDMESRRPLAGIISDDELLKRAIENVKRLGCVGTQERIEEFLGKLSDRYGWSISPPKVRNRTVARIRREDLGRDTLRRIEAVTELDLALYEFVCAI